LADGGEPVLIDLVDAPRAYGVIGYQPGILEHSQVLRDGRAADGERTRDIDHGEWAVRKPLEDGAPTGIAEGVE
jgi:hypothetical protein